MLGIFFRSLKNNRNQLVIYSLASIAFLEIYIAMFPMMKSQTEQLTELLKMYPESFMKAFGFDTSQLLFDKIGAFLATEQFTFMWPIMAILFLVSYSNSCIAGEVDKGTMEMILSQPVSRIKIFIVRYLAGLTNFLIFTFVSVFAVVPLTLMHGIEFDIKSLTIFFLEAFLFGLAIYSLSMFSSSMFSDKGKASLVTSGVLIIMYVANIVAGLKDSFSDLKYFSFFHYYNPSSALVKNTIPDWTVLVFLGFSLVMFISAIFWFNKRDIAV